jgi:hypothetical protein
MINIEIMKPKILFLDFDGVLHPLGALKEDLFSRCSYLEDSCTNYPCEIVITSNWRMTNTLDEMILRLPPKIRSKVTGVTEVLQDKTHKRYQEIKNYLEDKKLDDVSWVALDDSYWEFPSSCSNLIRCNPNVGLAIAEQVKIVNWLNDKSS